MDKRHIIYFFIVYVLLLSLFSIYSPRTGIHDTGEYVTIAKAISGINNASLFSAHSIVYPVFLSFFINLSQGMLILKLTSIFWIFATSLVLYRYTKFGKKAFLLFALSPIVWYISIEVSPILPVTFLFLLSYLNLKWWDEHRKLKNLVLSGILMGFSVALWGGSLFLLGILGLVYLLNRKVSTALIFLVAAAVGFSPRLIIDHVMFGFFLQTTLRYFGANVTTLIGLGSSKVPGITLDLLLKVFLWIAPGLILIFIKRRKELRKEFWVILLFLLFFFFRSGQGRGIKYFIIIAPLVCLYLAQVLTKKQLIISSVLAVAVVLFWVAPYHFADYEEAYYQEDLISIRDELGYDTIIAGPSKVLSYSLYLWSDTPRIIWYEDFKLSKGVDQKYSEYVFAQGQTKLPLRKRMYLEISLLGDENNFDNLPIVAPRDMDFNEDGYVLEKCFRVLCVYSPVSEVVFNA